MIICIYIKKIYDVHVPCRVLIFILQSGDFCKASGLCLLLIPANFKKLQLEF